MLTPGAIMEIAAIGAVKAVEAVKSVLGRMGMHHVQQNVNAVAVSNVDQFLQLVRSSKATNSQR